MNIRTLVLILCSLAGSPWVTAATPPENAADPEQVQAIFAAHDQLGPGLDQYMASVADDVIHMPNGARTIEGKAAYRKHVVDFYASGDIRIRHEALAVYSPRT